MFLFDRFYNRYIIRGTITNTTPVHIGSGRIKFDPLETDNTIIRYTSDNKPFIPGSSLKGVLRSYIELIYPEEHCLITANPCTKKHEDEIKKLKEDESATSNPEEYAQKIYNLMCPICKVFGSQEIASKIYISDLKIKDESYHIGIRDGVGIDRDTGTAKDKYKYDFEVIEPGAVFELNMVIENLEKEYESILKMMIKALACGEIKIGGKTSRGLGCIVLDSYKIYKVDQGNLKKYIEYGLNEEMIWECEINCSKA